MIQFDLLAYFTPALHPRSRIQDRSFIYEEFRIQLF